MNTGNYHLVDTICAVCEATLKVELKLVIDGILEDRLHDGQLTNFICEGCMDVMENDI